LQRAVLLACDRGPAGVAPALEAALAAVEDHLVALLRVAAAGLVVATVMVPRVRGSRNGHRDDERAHGDGREELAHVSLPPAENFLPPDKLPPGRSPSGPAVSGGESAAALPGGGDC